MKPHPYRQSSGLSAFCTGDEPKSGLARDLGDRLQSRNVTYDTSGDYTEKERFYTEKAQFYHTEQE